MSQRFSYIKYDQTALDTQQALKVEFEGIENDLEARDRKKYPEYQARIERVTQLLEKLEDGRAKKLAQERFKEFQQSLGEWPNKPVEEAPYNKLEEAYMWTGKSIRDSQVLRHVAPVAELKERSEA